MRLTRVLQFVLSTCWAMEPGFHRRMVALLEEHSDGDADRVAKAITDSRARSQPYRWAGGGGDAQMIGVGVMGGENSLISGGGGDVGAGDQPFDARSAGMRRDRNVAVIPIRGVIAQRASQVDPICSDVGTSVEHIRNDLQAAMADDTVQAIVLEVDSPGGSVAGLDDLAADIRAARDRKPIVAHTDGMMASAAYWLSSQADKVYATRDAVVGSIGVIAGFLDNHRKLQQAGVDPVVIKSTPGKGHLQTSGSFGDEQRSRVQSDVDQFHRMFVDAVAAGRRVTPERATEMGDGRTRIGGKAEADGFVDGVRSFESAIKAARQLVRAAAPAAAAAAAATDAPKATDAAPPTFDGAVVTAGTAAPAAEIPPEAIPAEGTHETERDPMTEKQNVPGQPAPAPAAATTAPATTYESIKAERDRAMAIQRAAIPEQRDLVAKLIESGTPTEAALIEIGADLKARLEQAKTLPKVQHDPLARGNSAAVAGTPLDRSQAYREGLEGEELWREQWRSDKALRAEFEPLAARQTQMTMPNEDTRPGAPARRAVTGYDLYVASMRNEGKARLVASRDAIKKDTSDAAPLVAQ